MSFRASHDKQPGFNLEFYLALTGEFRPTCDPDKNIHTLAKLALGTIHKGERVHSNKYTYSPSWAENFSSEIVLTPHSKNTPRQVLWLGLHGPHKDLSVTQDRGQGLAIVTSSGIEEVDAEFELPISLSSQEQWSQSRAIIAMAAEAFFDTTDTPPPTPELTAGSGQV